MKMIERLFLNKYAKLISQHNEVTLYVIAISFLVTFLLNSDFRDFLFEVTELGSGSEGFLLVVIFFCSILFSVISAFYNRHMIFNDLLATFLIIAGTLLLAFEYLVSNLEFNNIVKVILLTYHILVLCILIATIAFAVVSGNFYSKKYSNPETLIFDVIIATFTVATVFVISYFFTIWHEISWAIPVSLAMFLYQFINIFELKQINLILKT